MRAPAAEGPLADIVSTDLRILLVAINPAPLSARLGRHFATPTNLFWKLLYAAGLTSRLFEPFEAPLLLGEGIGLTSLVERATRTAAELRRAERQAGATTLARTVDRLKPRVVALLGLTLFPDVFPDSREPGPGLKGSHLVGLARLRSPEPERPQSSLSGARREAPVVSRARAEIPSARMSRGPRVRP